MTKGSENGNMGEDGRLRMRPLFTLLVLVFTNFSQAQNDQEGYKACMALANGSDDAEKCCYAFILGKYPTRQKNTPYLGTARGQQGDQEGYEACVISIFEWVDQDAAKKECYENFILGQYPYNRRTDPPKTVPKKTESQQKEDARRRLRDWLRRYGEPSRRSAPPAYNAQPPLNVYLERTEPTVGGSLCHYSDGTVTKIQGSYCPR